MFPGQISRTGADAIYSDDDEDETAELMRELEKIKRERAEQRAKEVRNGVNDAMTGLTMSAGGGEGC